MPLTPSLSRTREREHNGAENPFSRLREKVDAPKARPDEGLGRDRPRYPLVARFNQFERI